MLAHEFGLVRKLGYWRGDKLSLVIRHRQPLNFPVRQGIFVNAPESDIDIPIARYFENDFPKEVLPLVKRWRFAGSVTRTAPARILITVNP